MYKGKRVVALIPARGGSKGVPLKNIRALAGSPLISYSISAAKGSKYLDRVLVSTDSEEIASIAKVYGAEVPFLRPKHLAEDASKGIDVVLHATDWLRKNSTESYDLLLLLQPTSPLRTAADVDGIVEELIDSGSAARCLVSVCECEQHPLWANQLPPDLSMESFVLDSVKNKNRQELPVYYRFNGALYLSEISYLEETKSFLGPWTKAYIMPQDRSLDIDTPQDFALAEILIKDTPEKKNSLAEFLKYHRYLLHRSWLGQIYRTWFLYPRLRRALNGHGLDIGCGIGDFLKFHPDCTGVDINPYNVEFCQRLGLRADLYDGLRLPYRDRTFDFVILDNVLEHITDPKHLLEEVRRVLKKDGTFVVGLPDKKGYASDSDHKIDYSDGDLRKLLERYSLTPTRKLLSPVPFEGAGEFVRQQCRYNFFKLST